MPVKPTMLACKAAGTYVEDAALATTSPLLRWANQECRTGSLREAVRRFAESQQERLDPDLVLVTQVDEDGLLCHIPSRQSDYESNHTFPVSVGFKLNPFTGEASLHPLVG